MKFTGFYKVLSSLTGFAGRAPDLNRFHPSYSLSENNGLNLRDFSRVERVFRTGDGADGWFAFAVRWPACGRRPATVKK